MSGRRYMDCPIPWCDGLLDQHGAEGDGPERWWHSGGAIDLGHGATIHRGQEGSGDSVWSLIIDRHGVYEDSSPQRIAKTLRAVADSVEAVGAERPRNV